MLLQFKQTAKILFYLKAIPAGGGGLLVEKLTSLSLKNPQILFLFLFGKFFLTLLSYQILLGKRFFCNLHLGIIDKNKERQC